MHNTFVFDIETIPDTENARRLNGWKGLDDHDTAEALFATRRAETGGSEFIKLYLQKIIAISVVFRTKDKLSVWSLGEEQDDESTLLTRFFAGIEKYKPTLVSWNGSGFDLPVIHYRSLLHGITSPIYWEMGENDSQFRYNNYISRYHLRHTDLMDLLALYQPKAFAPLDDIASLLGFPGKMGMSGAKVWDAYQAGEISDIRNYCETDVLNTYLVYLRFQLIRGILSQESYQHEISLVKSTLKNSQKNHLLAFLNAMNPV